MADTNDDVMKINNEKLQQLLATNTAACRIISRSRHSPVGALTQAPNELIKENLYKIKQDKYCLPYIDLAIGFGFHTAIQEEQFPMVNSFHTLKNRELPIVFVKMDKYTGT